MQQARAQATRESIIGAAGIVFARLSYSSATLADVIAEAGVTQGALYFHFDSKQDLAEELIKRQHERSSGLSARFLSSEMPGIESLIQLSGELARQITTDPIVQGGLRLSTESPELFPNFASKPYRDWIDMCEHFIQKAIDEGDVSAVPDARTQARFVISAFTGTQVVSQALTGWDDLYDRLEEMWSIILRAILSNDRLLPFEKVATLVRAAATV